MWSEKLCPSSLRSQQALSPPPDSPTGTLCRLSGHHLGPRSPSPNPPPFPEKNVVRSLSQMSKPTSPFILRSKVKTPLTASDCIRIRKSSSKEFLETRAQSWHHPLASWLALDCTLRCSSALGDCTVLLPLLTGEQSSICDRKRTQTALPWCYSIGGFYPIIRQSANQLPPHACASQPCDTSGACVL